MALLLKSESLRVGIWQSELARLLPDLAIRRHPEIGDPREIEFALVWRPPTGLLAGLPRLRLIMSLGAGVDHIFADPELPQGVPIMRLVDADLIREMSEFLMLQVLRLHRQDLAYAAQQRDGIWQERLQPPSSERRVGILGLGRHGADIAMKLAALGFDVAGWSRRPKTLPGIACYDGKAGLAALLARTEILICLLPLTAETAGILGQRTFSQLPRGAAVINVGRGRHLIEADLLAALDEGQVGAAILDVFATEPLPPEHPFWRHPRILVTPHVAAATNPLTAAPIIAEAIRRCRAGEPVENLVDRASGY